MAVPFHWIIRRKSRALLNKVLIKLISPKVNFDKIDPKSINRILLIRLNYRIGNIIFMTPLIRAIEKLMPHAKIDMLVGAAFTKPIVKGMPNIYNVYDAPRKLLKSPIKLRKFVKELNKNNYDLLISPISGSVSSNIAISLIEAPIKLGIYDENNFSALNRFVKKDPTLVHSALSPLAIMDIFTEKKEYNHYLDIALNEEEKLSGKRYLEDLLEKYNIKVTPNTKVISIFKDARNDKKIEPSWWNNFVDEITKKDSNIIFVDILDPKEEAPLKENMPYIKEKNLRVLGSILSSFDSFICADTGPMHLASASGTAVIALFNATSPSTFGPLGKKDNVIVINNKNTEEVAKETLNILNNN